jgi:hypothetical protein
MHYAYVSAGSAMLLRSPMFSTCNCIRSLATYIYLLLCCIWRKAHLKQTWRVPVAKSSCASLYSIVCRSCLQRKKKLLKKQTQCSISTTYMQRMEIIIVLNTSKAQCLETVNIMKGYYCQKINAETQAEAKHRYIISLCYCCIYLLWHLIQRNDISYPDISHICVKRKRERSLFSLRSWPVFTRKHGYVIIWRSYSLFQGTGIEESILSSSMKAHARGEI